MNVNVSPTLEDQRRDVILAALNSGYTVWIALYSGPMPALAGAPGGGNTLLCEIEVTTTPPTPVAVPDSPGGLAVIPGIPPGAVLTTGTVAWAQVRDASNTPLMNLDVTDIAGNGAIKLSSVDLAAGHSVDLDQIELRERP
jgi:hypothetical protein